MRNSLIVALAGLLGASSAISQTRSLSDMETIASDFFNTKARQSTTRLKVVSSKDSYRVYAPVNGDGFVIVSSICGSPEILGFSKDGNFDETDMVAAAAAFLDGTSSNEPGIHLNTIAQSDVSPLLEDIQFNQRAPFNDQCPLLNEKRTLTGCIATAMAQVMAYYRYPTQMSGDAISYQTTTNKIQVDWSTEATKFDWNNIAAQYKTSYTESQAAAVAQLLGACGASIQADYGTSSTGSNAKNMFLALNNNFGYDDGMVYVSSTTYPSLSHFEEIILNEILESRPVLAGGISADGVSHQFVIDGVKNYNGTPYFHFNWGWSGKDDGYYLLNLTDSSSSTTTLSMNTYDVEGPVEEDATNKYCYNFHIVYGIKPEDSVTTVGTFTGKSIQATETEYAPGDMINLTVTELRNASAATFVGAVKVVLVSKDSDNEIAVGTLCNLSKGLACNLTYKSLSKTLTIPATVPDGEYEVALRPVTTEASTTWNTMVANPLTITISGNTTGVQDVTVTTENKDIKRYTLDGRPIPAGVQVRGLIIEDGKVVLK